MSNATRVTQFIVEEFAPDLRPDELAPDYDLLGHAIIDSLGLLTLLAWVEEEFGVEVDAAEVDREDFRSVDAICALIDASPDVSIAA